MDYNEAIEYIHGVLRFGSKLGLNNIKMMLELMDNPHDKLKYVHVAGTNGKGSTIAFLSSILIQQGYKVGVYTSPYLERFTERIKICNNEISQNDIARITAMVKEKADDMVRKGNNHPTEFEIVTAIAFQYFYQKNCDIVLLEVGLGGRFDATNVIATPLLSIITTINFDHQSILGNTLREIAFEKAGIIKKKSDVLIYRQPDEVENVISSVCLSKKAKMHRIDFDSLSIVEQNIDRQIFNYKEYQGLEISLLGEHQVKNAVVAVEASEILDNSKGFSVSESSIRKGLIAARWPGRLQIVKRNPLFIVDGAHNPQGVSVLCDTLKKNFGNKRKIFIMGVLKDKDYITMIESVVDIADYFITVTPDSERAVPAEELAIVLKNYCNKVSIGGTIEGAIKKSLEISSPDDVICAFGSLYYVGEVIRYFKTQD